MGSGHKNEQTPSGSHVSTNPVNPDSERFDTVNIKKGGYLFRQPPFL